MNERLTIARELLTYDGFLLISIDESEPSQLKILCDHIFGENNFQTTLHIQVRYAQKSLTEEKDFKPVVEYVFSYSKNISRLALKEKKKNIQRKIQQKQDLPSIQKKKQSKPRQ